MNVKICIITAIAAIGVITGCSSSLKDVAKTNAIDGRPDSGMKELAGTPGVDFPAPFLTGERNANIYFHHQKLKDGVSVRRSAPEYLPDEYVLNEEEADYEIGRAGTDWNRERAVKPRSRHLKRDRDNVSTRAAVMNREPVEEVPYGTAIPTYSADETVDETVNVANLADADLISRFHMANQREIELGRLAQERGNSEWVRSLGRRIAMDNSYSDKRLMRLTRSLELNVPTDFATADNAAHVNVVDTSAMDSLSEADFDKEIVRQIFSAQQEKVGMLKSAQDQMPKDSRLGELVSTLIPIAEQDMQVAQNISNKYLGQNI